MEGEIMIETFDNLISSLKATAQQPFKPYAIYNPDGDMIECQIKEGAYDATRIDGLLTVYHDIATNELIGMEIKGVRKIMNQTNAFGIVVNDGKIKIGHVILAMVSHEGGVKAAEGEAKQPIHWEYLRVMKLAEAAPPVQIEAAASV